MNSNFRVLIQINMLREFIENPTELIYPKKTNSPFHPPYYEDLSGQSSNERHYVITLIRDDHFEYFNKCFESRVPNCFTNLEACQYVLKIIKLVNENYLFEFYFTEYQVIRNSNNKQTLRKEITIVKLNINLTKKSIDSITSSVESTYFDSRLVNQKCNLSAHLIPLVVVHFVVALFNIWNDWRKTFINFKEARNIIANGTMYNKLEQFVVQNFGKEFFYRNCNKLPPELYLELLKLTKTDVKNFQRLYQFLKKKKENNYDNLKEVIIDFYAESCKKTFTANEKAIINDYLRHVFNNINLNIKSFKRLRELHDEFFRNNHYYEEVAQFTIENKFDVLEDTDKYTFTYINTSDKLIEEGEKMKHCVTSYQHQLINYECGLYHANVKGDEVGFTAEITLNDNDEYECVQLAGYNNCDAPTELWTEIKTQLAVVNQLKNITLT